MSPRRRRSPSRWAVWLRQNRRAIRRGLVIAAVIMAALTLCQVSWPADRALPFVRAAGQPVGGRSTGEIAQALEAAYQKSAVTVVGGDKKITRSLSDIGAEQELVSTARQAADYPFGLRLVPFSSLYIMGFRNTPFQLKLDNELLQEWAVEISQNSEIPPKNANIIVDNGRARLVKAELGKTYPAEVVLATLKNTRYYNKTIVSIKPKATTAARGDKEVEVVVQKAQQKIDTKLVLKVEGKKITAPKAEVGDWLTFPEDEQSGRLSIALKDDKIAKYLKSLRFKSYREPGTSNVRMVDDREVSRKVGPSGWGVDVATATPLVKQAVMEQKNGVIDLPVGAISPHVTYDKHYSNSDANLAGRLASIVDAKGDYGIAVMEVDGRSAHSYGDQQFISASTYKLYLAYAIFKQIEAGRMSWSDNINGQTLEKCFELMIVHSDNPCPQTIGRKIGWANVEKMIHATGVSKRTTFTSDEFYTTARDLAYFLYRVENASIISAKDRARLIGLMKEQLFRRAIPAGVNVTVADKPGWLYGMVHDAGIVYSPQGTYIMVIMTDGSSWDQLADAARQVHAYISGSSNGAKR